MRLIVLRHGSCVAELRAVVPIGPSAGGHEAESPDKPMSSDLPQIRHDGLRNPKEKP